MPVVLSCLVLCVVCFLLSCAVTEEATADEGRRVEAQTSFVSNQLVIVKPQAEAVQNAEVRLLFTIIYVTWWHDTDCYMNSTWHVVVPNCPPLFVSSGFCLACSFRLMYMHPSAVVSVDFAWHVRATVLWYSIKLLSRCRWRAGEEVQAFVVAFPCLHQTPHDYLSWRLGYQAYYRGYMRWFMAACFMLAKMLLVLLPLGYQ